jgi:hypothetical protein
MFPTKFQFIWLRGFRAYLSVIQFIVSIFKQGQRKAWRIPSPKNLPLWPWKSIGFQILSRTMYVPSLVKIHWKMLILECSQGCYAVKIWPLDLWPWKSIGFQTHLRTKYVPSLVKIHWMMLILVFTGMSHGKNLTRRPWPLTNDLENQ